MWEKLEKILKKRKSTPEVPTGPQELTDTTVAILATDGFEQSELFEPKAALEAAGAKVYIVSLRPGKIKAWDKQNWGKSIAVDLTVREAWDMHFDYLVLPGGVINPDHLRNDSEAVSFAMSFVNSHRPIAAICHGPQLLIETGSLKGKVMTSWPSLKTDLLNAGAKWIDEEVVVDHNLITSRKPEDIPAFNREMIKEFTYKKAHPLIPNTEGYVVTL